MYDKNWYYNPLYINENNYINIQHKMQYYQQSQDAEVLKAFHAYQNFLDASSKLDSEHQYELFCYCLADFARRNNWHQ